MAEEIMLTMPNKHRILLADLGRFGLENEVFVDTDEPYGYISATIKRS